ncbi:MAG TPA: ATP-grasp domain-containing protein [Oscillatoriaceae cyanobacterium]
MTRPVVIVDPIDSGAELAPAFAARGVPAIAVRSIPGGTWDGVNEGGYAAKIHSAHFEAIYEDGPDLVETLRRHDPMAVIAGAESGVALSDRLAAVLTPQIANVPDLSRARRHKGAMQEALAKSGLPVIRTLNTASPAEVMAWLKEQNLTDAPLILKPATSAGSDNVHHVAPGGDWRSVFERILASRTKLRWEPNETVIVQEQVFGTEFAVDTVSADGEHVLAHLIRYNKTSAGDRMTVFDHTEFLPFDDARYGALLAYVRQALDAVGIRWGAAHSEVMLTPDGPRLIEVGARTCGGPVLGFSRVATGSSQLERVIEAYVDREIRSRTYDFKRTVVPVFLIAPLTGILRNVEELEQLRALPTHLSTHMWLGNGDRVLQTVDFDTTLGIVGLAGEREAVFADYQRVREVEARLRIEPLESEELRI